MTTQPLPLNSPPVLTSPHRAANTTPSSTKMTPNVTNVVLGNHHMKPWFPSFYPEDVLGSKRVEWLWVCPWCFKYCAEIVKGIGHGKVCELRTAEPVGEVVYEKDGYAIYEVDGEVHKLYAQNLSLFAKLFLETKSVFFDASTFLYYTLVQRPDPTTSNNNNSGSEYGQVIGFFSKEKMSWDNNNVACILIFPPWLKRGLGQILIAASYELGKREGRFGGPERPLSKLGRKGYIAYWCAEVARCILNAPSKRTLSVKEISDATWILPEDVVAAVKEMDVVEGTRRTAAGNVLVSKGRVRAWVEWSGVSMEPLVDVDAFAVGDSEEDEDEEHEDG